MQDKRFLRPAEVARDLAISSSTVLRLIHSGELPAIAVSKRIYRIPVASFEMYKAGTLRKAGLAPIGPVRPRQRLGEGERPPVRRSTITAAG